MGPTRSSITIPAGDIDIPGYLCLPDRPITDAAIIVFHGSDGFKQHNHGRVAEDLANAGFPSLAVTWFGGKSKRSAWGDLRVGDMKSVANWLTTAPNVHANRLGLMGHSRGGGLAVAMAALLPRTRAVVNYFGLTDWPDGYGDLIHLPFNPKDPLDFVARIPCPILTLHGAADTVVPVHNALQLDAACRQYGIDHRMTTYPGVNHSFVWPGDKNDPAAHDDSWQRVLRFLNRHLIPPQG